MNSQKNPPLWISIELPDPQPFSLVPNGYWRHLGILDSPLIWRILGAKTLPDENMAAHRTTSPAYLSALGKIQA